MALFIAPVVRPPAATPSSSIFVASACAKAPFWFCSQLGADDGQGPNAAHDCPLSHEQGAGGFANAVLVLQKVQNTFDFPPPAPVEYNVLLDGPVVTTIGTASAPRSAQTSGAGQPWPI